MTTRRALLGAAPWVLSAKRTQAKHPVTGKGEHTYEMIHDWGETPSHIRYGNTHGVAHDRQGHIFIAHDGPTSDSILVFDQKGKFVRSWGTEFRGGAHGLHIQREGRADFLYLVDTGKGRSANVDPSHTWMVKMTLTGEEVMRIGYPKESPKYPLRANGERGVVYSPTNIAIAPGGDIYVADGYGVNCISQYDATGRHIRTFGEKGNGPGQMLKPHGLIVDTRGQEPVLLVADRSNFRLQTFTLDGRHLGFAGGIKRPCHFDERKGVMVVPDLAARVTLLDRRNEPIVHLGEDASETWQQVRKQPRSTFTPGKFICPHGACFDQDGNIFVAEWVEVGRVTKLRRV
jgi:hypothetical protein